MAKKLNTCNRDIASAKRRLIKKAVKKKGLWENFGYCEVMNLRDKYHWDMTINADENHEIESAITDFADWCSTFSYTDLQRYMTA